MKPWNMFRWDAAKWKGVERLHTRPEIPAWDRSGPVGTSTGWGRGGQGGGGGRNLVTNLLLLEHDELADLLIGVLPQMRCQLLGGGPPGGAGAPSWTRLPSLHLDVLIRMGTMSRLAPHVDASVHAKGCKLMVRMGLGGKRLILANPFWNRLPAGRLPVGPPPTRRQRPQGRGVLVHLYDITCCCCCCCSCCGSLKMRTSHSLRGALLLVPPTASGRGPSSPAHPGNL